MTCQLNSDQYNAKDLRFEFRLYPKRRSEPRIIQASPSDIHVVNASVVELNFTNVRQRYDRATVRCYHQNRRALSASQIIKVGREYFCMCYFYSVWLRGGYRWGQRGHGPL